MPRYICSLCGQEKLVAFTCGDSSFPFTGRLPTPNAKKVCSPQFFIWSLNCYNIQINRFYTSSHKSTVKRFLRLCHHSKKAIFGPFLPLIVHFSIFCGEEQRKKGQLYLQSLQTGLISNFYFQHLLISWPIAAAQCKKGM